MRVRNFHHCFQRQRGRRIMIHRAKEHCRRAFVKAAFQIKQQHFVRIADDFKLCARCFQCLVIAIMLTVQHDDLIRIALCVRQIAIDIVASACQADRSTKLKRTRRAISNISGFIMRHFRDSVAQIGLQRRNIRKALRHLVHGFNCAFFHAAGAIKCNGIVRIDIRHNAQFIQNALHTFSSGKKRRIMSSMIAAHAIVVSGGTTLLVVWPASSASRTASICQTKPLGSSKLSCKCSV